MEAWGTEPEAVEDAVEGQVVEVGVDAEEAPGPEGTGTEDGLCHFVQRAYWEQTVGPGSCFEQQKLLLDWWQSLTVHWCCNSLHHIHC